MSNFQKRIDSKARVNGLEKEFVGVIEKFIDQNPDLTMAEVGKVMLRMLTQANDSEVIEELK